MLAYLKTKAFKCDSLSKSPDGKFYGVQDFMKSKILSNFMKFKILCSSKFSFQLLSCANASFHPKKTDLKVIAQLY